jgi:hypothetical protein
MNSGIRTLSAVAAGILGAAVLAGPASADLITGTFTGTVYDSQDDTDVFGAGTGYDVVNGLGVTGTFSYVFEDVPANQCGSGYGCHYDFNGVNWLNMSVTINGVTLTIPITNTYFQGLHNYDKATAGYDLVQLNDHHLLNVYDAGANDSIFRHDYIYAYFVDFLTEFAPGDGVPSSSFVWTDDDASDYGYGGVSWENSIYDHDTGTYSSYNYAIASWTLNSLTLQGAQITQVPEPGTLALFGVGLAGLGWMSRRRRAG